jgi:hypothetical protein
MKGHVRQAGVDSKDRTAEWLKLAEEARAIANEIRDPTSKKTMMEIAKAYDRLAGLALSSKRDRGHPTS